MPNGFFSARACGASGLPDPAFLPAPSCSQRLGAAWQQPWLAHARPRSTRRLAHLCPADRTARWEARSPASSQSPAGARERQVGPACAPRALIAPCKWPQRAMAGMRASARCTRLCPPVWQAVAPATRRFSPQRPPASAAGPLLPCLTEPPCADHAIECRAARLRPAWSPGASTAPSLPLQQAVPLQAGRQRQRSAPLTSSPRRRGPPFPGAAAAAACTAATRARPCLSRCRTRVSAAARHLHAPQPASTRMRAAVRRGLAALPQPSACPKRVRT